MRPESSSQFGFKTDPSKPKDGFPTWPHFADDEIDQVQEVLRSGRVNYWTGEHVRAFEREFANFCNTKYGVALTNGSVALELALRCVGVKRGDEVIVTPRTFIASASSIALVGARPVFADIDPESQNITVDTIRQAVTSRTRAIVAVHLAGWPCDMDPIIDFAEQHGLKIIEDCAQAHGATYKDRPVGSMGHAAAFSFCQDKIMTTGGEGGVLVTNDQDIWEKAWSYKDHGKSYRVVFEERHAPGFRWLYESLGTNWRMTEMQAALGRAQLRKLPAWLGRRRQNARILTNCFKDIAGLRVTVPFDHVRHAYYKYYVFVRPDRLAAGWDRLRVMEEISARGVPCSVGTCPEVYMEKALSSNQLRPTTRLPMAKELGETSLTFLVHPTLNEKEMDITCSTVNRVLTKACR